MQLNDRYVSELSSKTSSLITCCKERISCILHYGINLATIRNRHDINFYMISNCFIGDNNGNYKFIWDNYDINDNYKNWNCCVAQPYENDNNEYYGFIQNQLAQWHNYILLFVRFLIIMVNNVLKIHWVISAFIHVRIGIKFYF